MSRLPTRIAMVSMHTSPAEQAGTSDAGGMNVAILSTAAALAEHGIAVDLLTRAVGSRLAPATPVVTPLQPGVTLYELAAGPAGVVPKEELGAVADEFGEAVANLAGRVSPRYDIVHAHYWLSGLAVLPVALELGLPFVQSFHTVAAMKNRVLAPGHTAEPEQRVRTEMFLANQASAIIAGSAAEASALIDEVRAPAEKLWVIPPGADVQLFTPTRNSDATRQRICSLLDLDPVRPIITTAGRVQPLKDQLLAVHVLAALVQSPAGSGSELRPMLGLRPVLVIVGEPTPGNDAYLSEVLAQAAVLGVLADVSFVGALGREILADLFAISSLTLMTSQSETFGLVALESAASGTPVVAFAGSGMLESVADGVSGVLVASREPREWALAVRALLEDGRRLAALSATARHHAEAFTWAATAAAMVAVYSNLLS